MSQPAAPASAKKAKLAAALKRNMARRKAGARRQASGVSDAKASARANSDLRSRDGRGEPQALAQRGGMGRAFSAPVRPKAELEPKEASPPSQATLANQNHGASAP